MADRLDLLAVYDADTPENLAQAVDVAVRMARMNYLLLLGFRAHLEGGISASIDDDVATLAEVAERLDFYLLDVQKFAALKTAPVVALPPRAGA